MNKWIKIVGTFSIVAIVTAILVSAVAFAQGSGDFKDGHAFGLGRGFDGQGEFFQKGPGRPGHHRGAHGKVTAIGEDSLTLENRDGESVTVNVSEDTRVMIAETQSEGSLSDIEVGDNVGVRGRRNEDGSVEARGIIVLPAGDIAGGRVTEVDGATISVENPKDGAATIVTNNETQFRVGKDGDGSLADVVADKLVMAFGETQDDGSLLARIVVIHERGPGHGPREGFRAGEVTSVEGTTFKIDPFRGDNKVTVRTDDSTEYRSRDDEEVSFEDIQVGRKVMVKGEPVEGQENTIQAEVVGIKVD